MPMKLLERLVDAIQAQTQAINRQTEAISGLASAQRELADEIRQDREANDGVDRSPFAHLGELDDRPAPHSAGDYLGGEPGIGAPTL